MAGLAALLRAQTDGGDTQSRAVLDRLRGFVTGVESYRQYPYRRELSDPPAIWSSGSARLLDYGQTATPITGASRRGAANARPVVFVPSLINRSYILDLDAERSLLRWLAIARVDCPLRPLLLDWNAPGDEERAFGLSDYIVRRLEPALQAVVDLNGRPPILVGYCMGGLLAIAAAIRRPDLVGGLGLLATPWNFHADHGVQSTMLGALWPHLEPLFATLGEVPVDALQCFFFAHDPFMATRKFDQFSRTPQDGEKARRFVALEDWINDGVPLSVGVARECFVSWYGENRPHRDLWQVGDATIVPRNLSVPTFIASPRDDRIVPPGSSMALAEQIGHALVLRPPVGHVGMIVGGRAVETFWRPFAEWLRSLD